MRQVGSCEATTGRRRRTSQKRGFSKTSSHKRNILSLFSMNDWIYDEKKNEECAPGCSAAPDQYAHHHSQQLYSCGKSGAK